MFLDTVSRYSFSNEMVFIKTLFIVKHFISKEKWHYFAYQRVGNMFCRHCIIKIYLYLEIDNVAMFFFFIVIVVAVLENRLNKWYKTQLIM